MSSSVKERQARSFGGGVGYEFGQSNFATTSNQHMQTSAFRSAAQAVILQHLRIHRRLSRQDIYAWTTHNLDMPVHAELLKNLAAHELIVFDGPDLLYQPKHGGIRDRDSLLDFFQRQTMLRDQCEDCVANGQECDKVRPVCGACRVRQREEEEELAEQKRQGKRPPRQHPSKKWRCHRLRAGLRARDVADAYITVQHGDRKTFADAIAMKKRPPSTSLTPRDRALTARVQAISERRKTQVLKDLQALVEAGHLTKIHDNAKGGVKQSEACKLGQEVCLGDTVYAVPSVDINIDEDLKSIWSGLELPTHAEALRRELKILGHEDKKRVGEDGKVKLVATKKKRKKRAARSKNVSKLTNAHLLDKYSWLADQNDPKG